jgi:hypothetical protein
VYTKYLVLNLVDYRGLSILSVPLIEQIWVFRKSISIYFLALARIYLFCTVYLITKYLVFNQYLPL